MNPGISPIGHSYFEYVPLLEIQREIYRTPVGFQRFQKYLQTMIGDSEDIALPLVGMNPMGKEHVPAYLDQLMAYSDDVARQAVQEANRRLSSPSALKVVLVVCDDLKGGWTNRYFSEAVARFNPSALLRRGWVVVPCWTSDSPSSEQIKRDTLAYIYRAVYISYRGQARTLGQRMRQEGYALAFAGEHLALDTEELAYTAAVIEPHLDSEHYPTVMACLYGDEAAQTLGYKPLGFTVRAGLELALHQALSSGLPPETALHHQPPTQESRG